MVTKEPKLNEISMPTYGGDLPCCQWMLRRWWSRGCRCRIDSPGDPPAPPAPAPGRSSVYIYQLVLTQRRPAPLSNTMLHSQPPHHWLPSAGTQIVPYNNNLGFLWTLSLSPVTRTICTLESKDQDHLAKNTEKVSFKACLYVDTHMWVCKCVYSTYIMTNPLNVQSCVEYLHCTFNVQFFAMYMYKSDHIVLML